MESPVRMKANSGRVLIGQPVFDWEKLGFDPREQHKGLLEGPEVLISPSGKLFLTFSASGCWSRFYKIGTLVLNGSDPMNANHWHHHPQPLLGEYEPHKVFGTGHASFTKSKDGKESYIIYHAMADPNAGEGGRTARLQKFDWDSKTGFPVFGHPASLDTNLPRPSGE
jgi:GH43 family beta-xylosidase